MARLYDTAPDRRENDRRAVLRYYITESEAIADGRDARVVAFPAMKLDAFRSARRALLNAGTIVLTADGRYVLRTAAADPTAVAA
jgi:hypothetical protein